MRHQVRLVFEPTEESDGDTRRPVAGEMRKVGSDVHTGSTARGFIHGTQTFPHGLAQRGFVEHGVRGWEGWNAQVIADALADRQECLSYFRLLQLKLGQGAVEAAGFGDEFVVGAAL